MLVSFTKCEQTHKNNYKTHKTLALIRTQMYTNERSAPLVHDIWEAFFGRWQQNSRAEWDWRISKHEKIVGILVRVRRKHYINNLVLGAKVPITFIYRPYGKFSSQLLCRSFAKMLELKSDVCCFSNKVSQPCHFFRYELIWVVYVCVGALGGGVNVSDVCG